ncbi:MAG TPA: YbaY family lipoprotein [Pyrinomonadaceae bacterium]|jgi:uncharacterized lipoprotein YbaY
MDESNASCATDDEPLVTGSILFDEDAGAFSGATVYVRLEDVTYADAASKVLAEQVMRDVSRAEGGSDYPLEFRLYGRLTDKRASYNLRVHVDVDGDGEVSLHDYVTMQSYPVLTQGRPRKLNVRVHEVK